MSNVVLVGFMGSGKSTVGPLLADVAGRPFVDLDDEITASAGRSVAAIFAGEGETGFRAREAAALRDVLARDGWIVAVGGGAPMDDDNWDRIRKANCVVALSAEPAELAARLDGANDRPLLEPDASTTVAALLPQRMPRYLEADLVVRTDGIAPAAVARRIAEQLPADAFDRITMAVPGAPHQVTVGARLTSVIASALQRLSRRGPVVVVTDDVVHRLHANPLMEAFRASEVDARTHIVPSGERAKDIAVLTDIYEALAAADVGRDGAMVVLGGGTVGDVAGFAAATWMRGIRYLQVPTTLLAMVDSSIGGKTAVNLPAGKNLVGAVHQPSAIFCDLEYLATLPDGDYRAALAEIVKAAIIADRGFFDWLTTNTPGLLQRDAAIVREAVQRAIAIKADVVARDPNESGPRAILNYGHTIGHAIERATGYGRLRHGEAVAWGMQVSARISAATGRCSSKAVEAQTALLERCGLLEARPRVHGSPIVGAMRYDKKARAGEVRWVLLRDIGDVEYGCAVDPAVCDAALADVLGG